jgi:hypothetical protein
MSKAFRCAEPWPTIYPWLGAFDGLVTQLNENYLALRYTNAPFGSLAPPSIGHPLLAPGCVLYVHKDQYDSY